MGNRVLADTKAQLLRGLVNKTQYSNKCKDKLCYLNCETIVGNITGVRFANAAFPKGLRLCFGADPNQQTGYQCHSALHGAVR